MRNRSLGVALSSALVVWLVAAQLEARGDDTRAPASAEETARRELLEGTRGRREEWGSVPALVILTPVMEYTSADMSSAYRATGEQLTAAEIEQLTSDLTGGLAELTGGSVTAFSAIRLETIEAGQGAKVFRPGRIVVGRFSGVQAMTGSLGYGGRMTRNGVITAASVILDREFDRNSDRRELLRTHELGHALGYNHVESCPSVMNPRVGSGITDFDRIAMKQAFLRLAQPAPGLGAGKPQF